VGNKTYNDLNLISIDKNMRITTVGIENFVYTLIVLKKYIYKNTVIIKPKFKIMYEGPGSIVLNEEGNK
tara:strand:+ start:712 stop:918 length:207 start_codon:yes stop_codon:yes gene_type:complete